MSENWKITHNSGGQMATVSFHSVSKETIKTLQGLSKSALRASGKEIRKILRSEVPMRSKRFKNHIASWAFVGKNDGIPQLQVGFYGWQRVKKNHKQPSRANPHWLEFGTKPHTITAGVKTSYTTRGGQRVRQTTVTNANAQILGNNGYFYAKTVQHPGQTGQHILRNAVYDNIDRIRAAQEQYLQALNDELEKAQQKIEESEDVEDD